MTGIFSFKILVFVESISSCFREPLGSTEDETGSQTNLTVGSADDQYKTGGNSMEYHAWGLENWTM